jgi:LmbE family N-acetylglucosaminyl deacetylase
MTRVVVIAAHPDDETLGVGGTIANHVDRGDTVCVLILGRGLASRGAVSDGEYSLLEKNCIDALKILGVENVQFENFPDNSFDSVPLLEIVKSIESHARDFDPEIVYTHHQYDLNIDHRITFDAVLTAFRPLPNSNCQQILSFEVVSASHWRNYPFNPTVFINISKNLDKKINALNCYDSEMHAFPHARSTEAVAALAKFRGSTIGCLAAEAFVPARIILKA